jgi:hypothetical protein
MAAFARVYDDLSQDIHGRSLAGLVIREKRLRPFKNQLPRPISTPRP